MDSDTSLQRLVQKLKAQLEKCKEQRDAYMHNFHEVCKIPFQERKQDKDDCDEALEKEGPQI